MNPANPILTPIAQFFAHREAQEHARIEAYGRELARYAADPEGYEMECQLEDERQAAEHDVGGARSAGVDR